MNRYKSYWDRTCVSPHLHQALRDIGSRPSPRPCLPGRRWAALAACCALIFGLSWGRRAVGERGLLENRLPVRQGVRLRITEFAAQ